MRGAKISTRYEEGVLKKINDLGGGAKILHDYLKVFTIIGNVRMHNIKFNHIFNLSLQMKDIWSYI